jgi:hypothetical protein
MTNIFAILTVSVALFALWAVFRPKSRLPLPPGPKPWPIVGNFFDWPSNGKEWETFAIWKEKYGSVVLRHARVDADMTDCRRYRLNLDARSNHDHHQLLPSRRRSVDS